MKKKKILLLFISVMLFATTLRVNAEASLSVSASNVNPGQSFTATVNVSGAASWAIYVSASGPVSGCSINEANASDTGMNTSKTFSTTCTATGTGTISINLSGNTTDESGDFSTPVYGSKTVTVTNPTPPPDPTPTPTPTPSNPSTPSVSPVTGGEDNRSGNTNLSSIKVENYKLNTDDSIHYTLSVPHSISSVKIEAKAADAKASVSGAGTVTLKVGENEFEIVVTAENGTKKSYYVKIVRKDTKYPFNDLAGALKDSDDVAVVLSDKDIITKSMLEQIQKERKVMRFVRYKEDGSSLYTWIVDGNKLGNLKDFHTGITFKFEDEDDFDEISGYRKGMYVQFAEKSGFPKGVSCKVNVNEHFKNNDLINLYSYDRNNKVVELADKALKVQDGTVLFSVKTLSNYFLTKALIEKAASSDSGVYKLASAIEFVALFFVVCIFVMLKSKKKKKDVPAIEKPTEPIDKTLEPVSQNPPSV